MCLEGSSKNAKHQNNFSKHVYQNFYLDISNTKNKIVSDGNKGVHLVRAIHHRKNKFFMVRLERRL